MHVTLLAAQSLDGRITRYQEPGSGFTSQADKAHFSQSLKLFDCRVMGAETYRNLREVTRRTAKPTSLQFVVTRTPAKFKEDEIPGALDFTDADPKTLLQRLQDIGRRRCVLLGGAKIYSLYLDAGCVDELWLTIEPVLFGEGTALLAGRSDATLELLSTEPLSANTLLLKYRVTRS